MGTHSCDAKQSRRDECLRHSKTTRGKTMSLSTAFSALPSEARRTAESRHWQDGPDHQGRKEGKKEREARRQRKLIERQGCPSSSPCLVCPLSTTLFTHDVRLHQRANRACARTPLSVKAAAFTCFIVGGGWWPKREAKREERNRHKRESDFSSGRWRQAAGASTDDAVDLVVLTQQAAAAAHKPTLKPIQNASGLGFVSQ